jgi:hypothetical protein
VATHSTAPYGTTTEPEPSSWALGLLTFAGVIMLMMGGFHAFVGFIAIVEDEFFVAVPSGYVVALDATTWGWIHLILGLLVLLGGIAVLSGRVWGRVVGVVLAVFSAFANFLFVPYYPVWSLTIIALDILVIWALATTPVTAKDES